MNETVAGERLEAMGFRITEQEVRHADGATVAAEFHPPRRYCVHFHGQIVCIELPSPVPHPIA